MKDMGSYISWGQLTAAMGIVAITYSAGTEPAKDIQLLIQYIRQNASTLGIDKDRIALWGASANVLTHANYSPAGAWPLNTNLVEVELHENTVKGLEPVLTRREISGENRMGCKDLNTEAADPTSQSRISIGEN